MILKFAPSKRNGNLVEFNSTDYASNGLIFQNNFRCFKTAVTGTTLHFEAILSQMFLTKGNTSINEIVNLIDDEPFLTLCIFSSKYFTTKNQASFEIDIKILHIIITEGNMNISIDITAFTSKDKI